MERSLHLGIAQGDPMQIPAYFCGALLLSTLPSSHAYSLRTQDVPRPGSIHQIPDKCLLFGKIQVVDAFPDVKVQLVRAFPDIKVQLVSCFPDKPGKWQFVDAFPDFKVQFVDAFPDYKIEYVDSFPGCK